MLRLGSRNQFQISRCIQQNASRYFSQAVASSSSSSSLLVETSIDGNVATLTMNRLPVNSLSLEMCEAISSGIKEIEANPKVQGLVLASSSKSTFSAGLDLNELYNPDSDRLTAFWRSFQQVFLDLYGSRLAVIGAIEGNAPAAGCMLALSCDYRIMSSGSGKKVPLIGLNESQFGIVAPPFLGHLMLRTVGQREGEIALSLGKLYTPTDALQVKMADEVVDIEKVLERSYACAHQWAKIPPHARYASKMLARKQYLQELHDTRDEDVEAFKGFVMNEQVQKNLGAYLQSLKVKKK